MTTLLRRLSSTTDDLSPGLDDRTRLERWNESFSALRFACEQIRSDDEPFVAAFESVQIGNAGISHLQGSIRRIVRTRRHVAADDRRNFTLSIGSRGIRVAGPDGAESAVWDRGSAVLIDQAEATEMTFQGPLDYVAVTVPRSRLGELVPHPEDAAFRLIETDSGRFRYLASYANLLLTGDGSFDAPLAEHAKSALTDLVALAIGAGRDATMLAEARGMRAARLHEIRAQIKAGFADPAFSSSLLARRLGISATYLQKLLYETGATFTEHVLELRLQKAQAMLADPRHNGLKVSDIALACGFNEVSYFNRCFRRRFGASPTQCRG